MKPLMNLEQPPITRARLFDSTGQTQDSVLTHRLMTLTAHDLFSRSFRAIRPLQQFSILVAISDEEREKEPS